MPHFGLLTSLSRTKRRIKNTPLARQSPSQSMAANSSRAVDVLCNWRAKSAPAMSWRVFLTSKPLRSAIIQTRIKRRLSIARGASERELMIIETSE